ncbi:MAG: sulfite exporter TauE/SafE family protein [Cyclobacteriaceae bacterium]
MLLAGLILGLTGGLHCVGMCSPLVAAVSAKSTLRFSMVIYNLGRVFMYGVLGLVAAGFGTIVRLFQYQEVISWVLGGALIVTGIVLMSRLQISFLSKWVTLFVMRVQSWWSLWFKRRSGSALFVLGVLNGLLPCGLTYVAMTYGLLAETPIQGAAYMVMFGLGTVPVMQIAPWIFSKILHRFKFRFQRLASALLILSGALIMARTLMPHVGDMHEMHTVTTTEVLCK